MVSSICGQMHYDLLFPLTTEATSCHDAMSEVEATQEKPTEPTYSATQSHAEKTPTTKEDNFVGGLSQKQIEEGVNYTWEDLAYRVQIDTEEVTPDGRTVKGKDWKYLIRNMSGTAPKGRVLAIMGPSGAGKTTFLNTIAGRIRIDKTAQVEGIAYLNETVLTNAYKKVISFVAQDDIVMGKETPREALYFNYRMKTAAGHDEAIEATEKMLKRLYLTGCADTLLGIPGLIKGVSGGEKKRTNIGSELIINPRILILDEPTTGLDSVNALRVGNLMKDLAHNEGRTVMCTIHTPSSELFEVFDDLLLLAHGRVAYHGPREDAPEFFSSLGHPLPKNYNPSEHYMNLLQLPTDELNAIFEGWEKYAAEKGPEKNPCLQRGPAEPLERDEELLAHCKSQGASTGLQLVLLTKRSWRLTVRDPMSTFGRLVQTLFFAILIGLFYLQLDNNSAGVQDRLGAMFMIAINSVFLSIMNGVATFPPERAVFLQEQSNDAYSAWTYFLGKTFAETPFQIFFPVIYSCIVYWMAGLLNSAGAFFVFLLVIVMTSNTSYSFGLFATAFFPSAEVAMAFVPMAIMPMMIVAGLFANTERLDPYWVWLNYISFPRYAFTGIVVNEFDGIGSLCSPGQICQYNDGREVIAYLGFGNASWGLSVLLLGCIMIVLRILAAIALTVQGASRRSNLDFKRNLKIRDASPKGNASPSS